MLRATVLLLLLLLVAVALSANCELNPNNLTLIDDQPTLVKEVPNGQKFIIGNSSDFKGSFLYIANLKGTHYEMGKAYGELFAEEIDNNLKVFYKYYAGMIYDILELKIPTFLANKLTGGAKALLHKIMDLKIQITKKYANPRYYEEIKGIGAGSGKKGTAREVARLNVFPELVKAACTVAGVWNSATSNGQTLHVRALDWDFKNPISHYPVLTVYHPSDPKLHTPANFGWAGFVGSMTGVSEFISIGEKVWMPPKHSVKMTRYGNPWTYLFRDVLYDAHDL